MRKTASSHMLNLNPWVTDFLPPQTKRLCAIHCHRFFLSLVGLFLANKHNNEGKVTWLTFWLKPLKFYHEKFCPVLPDSACQVTLHYHESEQRYDKPLPDPPPLLVSGEPGPRPPFTFLNVIFQLNADFPPLSCSRLSVSPTDRCPDIFNRRCKSWIDLVLLK